MALGANRRPANLAALAAGTHPQAAQRGPQRRLARPPNGAGGAGRKAAGAGASLASTQAAFTWWRDLVASLDDEALNTPLGEAAGYFAGATGRSFVLHIADELIHHTAEAALLRDLFAPGSVRA